MNIQCDDSSAGWRQPTCAEHANAGAETTRRRRALPEFEILLPSRANRVLSDDRRTASREAASPSASARTRSAHEPPICGPCVARMSACPRRQRAPANRSASREHATARHVRLTRRAVATTCSNSGPMVRTSRAHVRAVFHSPWSMRASDFAHTASCLASVGFASLSVQGVTPNCDRTHPEPTAEIAPFSPSPQDCCRWQQPWRCLPQAFAQ